MGMNTVLTKARTGHWIIWSWSYRCLEDPSCGCWEPHSGPLEEQQEILAAEPSLQPPLYSAFFSRGNKYEKVLIINNHVCVGLYFAGHLSIFDLLWLPPSPGSEEVEFSL